MKADVVLDFWFKELSPSDWYKKNIDLDNRIKTKFHNIYMQAIEGELFSWRDSIEGRLAEIIVLDQFSRNMFRDMPEAFSFDSLALVLAQEAGSKIECKNLDPIKRAFIYLPFMHSESLMIHEKAVELYSERGLENNLEFEIKHKVIIEEFGRYPHRNSILGRKSTAKEIEFLKSEGSSF